MCTFKRAIENSYRREECGTIAKLRTTGLYIYEQTGFCCHAPRGLQGDLS